MKYWYNEDASGIRKYAHIIMLVLNEEGINKLLKYVSLKDKRFIHNGEIEDAYEKESM